MITAYEISLHTSKRLGKCIYVSKKDDAYTIYNKGSAKRKTGVTRMNPDPRRMRRIQYIRRVL
jgi:hypothetical protein